jgi:hypothetical protein
MSSFSLAMLFRGLAKVIFIAFIANEILTAAFTTFARQIDVGLTPQIVTVFSYVTCGLVSMWLQADARRAFAFAHQHGFVKAAGNPSQGLQIAKDCPKRWLVVLHSELHPAAVTAR